MPMSPFKENVKTTRQSPADTRGSGTDIWSVWGEGIWFHFVKFAGWVLHALCEALNYKRWVSAREDQYCIPTIVFSIKLTDYNWSFLKGACWIICLITTEKEMEIRDLRAGNSKQI